MFDPRFDGGRRKRCVCTFSAFGSEFAGEVNSLLHAMHDGCIGHQHEFEMLAKWMVSMSHVWVFTVSANQHAANPSSSEVCCSATVQVPCCNNRKASGNYMDLLTVIAALKRAAA